MKTLSMSVKTSICAGGVVVNDKGEVVLVQQNTLRWSFPKGHLEPDEDLLRAAKREIQEESGIRDLTLIKSFPPYKRFKIKPEGEQKELLEIHLFLFTTTEKNLKPEDPDNPDARWVKKEDVVNILSYQRDRDFFMGIISEI
jgi:8-oxo-dGTP pyrophosphatase MutT (NUDIX family)